jgi:hypothetical protein
MDERSPAHGFRSVLEAQAKPVALERAFRTLPELPIRHGMTDQPLNQRLRAIRGAQHDPVDEPAPKPPRRAPLGQILVEPGEVSPQNLARTLTEQHGFDVAGTLRARLGTSDGTGASDEGAEEQARDDRYLVRETSGDEPLHVASTFLDAADAAFELIEDRDPEQLEIVRARDDEFERAWSYRRAEKPTLPPLYPS